MKTIYSILVLTFLVGNLFSQDINFKTSESGAIKSPREVLTNQDKFLVGTINENIYAVKKLKKKFFIDKYSSELELKQHQEVKAEINKVPFYDAVIIENTLYSLYKNNEEISAIKINSESLTQEGEAHTLLKTTVFTDSTITKIDYNEKEIIVSYLWDNYLNVKVYNKMLENIDSFRIKNVSTTQYAKTKYFLLYDSSEKALFYHSGDNKEPYRVQKIKGGKVLVDAKIELPENFIFAYPLSLLIDFENEDTKKMAFDKDGDFIFTGIYTLEEPVKKGKGKFSADSGFFFLKIDKKTNEVNQKLVKMNPLDLIQFQNKSQYKKYLEGKFFMRYFNYIDNIFKISDYYYIILNNIVTSREHSRGSIFYELYQGNVSIYKFDLNFNYISKQEINVFSKFGETIPSYQSIFSYAYDDRILIFFNNDLSKLTGSSTRYTNIYTGTNFIMAEVSSNAPIKYTSLFTMGLRGIFILPSVTIKNNNDFIFYGTNNPNLSFSKFESYYSLTPKRNKLYKLSID